MKKNHNEDLSAKIISCDLCTRLRDHCEKIAVEKRRQFSDHEYWGKPVPGFGDPKAKLWVIGLAPAAHGANRTGRMFTGDQSGVWLYRALHRAGFANQPLSENRNDGLSLKDAYVSSLVRCAPPENKPSPVEIQNCLPFLIQENSLLVESKVVLCLGKIALDGFKKMLPEAKKCGFKHGAEMRLSDGRMLVYSYHPSQQNTFTKKLTESQFDSIFTRVHVLLNDFC